MFYLLLYPLHERFGILNVFRYITFRTAIAAVTAMLLSLLLGPRVIRCSAGASGAPDRPRGGAGSHRAKSGTPTMGGVLILISLLVPTLLWADVRNLYVCSSSASPSPSAASASSTTG